MRGQVVRVYNRVRPFTYMHVHAEAVILPRDWPKWDWQRCFRNGASLERGREFLRYIETFRGLDGTLSELGQTIQAEIVYYFSAIKWQQESRSPNNKTTRKPLVAETSAHLSDTMRELVAS